jgi:DNA-binding NarL/FixJ family response regulator
MCFQSIDIPTTLSKEIDAIISLDSDADTMRSAFIKVLKGETVREGIDTKKADAVSELCANLTPRQKEVLECIRIGKCNKEIARDLDLSLSTVKVHCMAIYRELGVSSRTQAALLLG